MSFVNEESGAVTVDWVVLTAALVGLGLATMGVVSTGVQSASASTASEVADTRIHGFFALREAIDFADGTGPFSGGGAEVLSDGRGAMIPSQGDGSLSTEAVFDVPPGAPEVRIGFDVLAMDSVDGRHGEGATVYLDGAAVARMTSDHGSPQEWTVTQAGRDRGVSFDFAEVSSGADVTGVREASHGGARGHDSVTRVSMTVSDHGGRLALGFGGRLDQGPADEALGVSALRVETDGL